MSIIQGYGASVNQYGSISQTQKNFGKVREKKQTESGQQVKSSESKLSQKAKDYLEKLRQEYGDYDFVVADDMDDKKALAKQGSKEFSVIFSSDELEKMSEDENYAQENMNKVQSAVEMSKRISEEFGFKHADDKDADLSNGIINKIAITFHDDGTTTIFAELEKSAKAQRERIDEAREKKAEEASKKDGANPYDRKDMLAVKRVGLEASSEEELLDKIRNLDWSTISEERRMSGERFDLSI